MGDIWEPWRPEIGQRVRVRTSAECRVNAYEATLPPGVDDDTLRRLMLDRMDVANRFATDTWITGHPECVDGAEGIVTDVRREAGMQGHYYHVMFGEAVGPEAVVGIDMAAIELEPADG